MPEQTTSEVFKLRDVATSGVKARMRKIKDLDNNDYMAAKAVLYGGRGCNVGIASQWGSDVRLYGLWEALLFIEGYEDNGELEKGTAYKAFVAARGLSDDEENAGNRLYLLQEELKDHDPDSLTHEAKLAEIRELEKKQKPKGKRPSLERIMELAEEDSGTGICIKCGHEQDGCEPDARKYQCEECGERAVYGAEEAVMMFC